MNIEYCACDAMTFNNKTTRCKMKRDLKLEVCEYLRTIPKGKVVTYGQIAEHLGDKHLSRVVGNILHVNPDPDYYPCFRVVNRAGRLAEHFGDGGKDGQKRRMERDGIEVVNYKVDLLSLYNALNDTHYDNVDDLTITTIDDVIYLGMKNDVSCAIDNRMALYEHQSSFNPNMPLRGFMYFGKLYNKEIKQNGYNIYGSKLIKIPTPQYYVFYNGTDDYPDRTVLRLSDAFQLQQEENDFEWTAVMLNINYGKNKILMDRCQTLKEYAILVSKIRKYQKIYTNLEIAITTAIDECIKENILKNFLLEHKSEVIDMCLTEYNEEEVMEMFRKESYEDGLREGEIKGRREGEINALITLYKDGTLSLKQVSERLNIPIENLKEYL